MSQMSLVDSIGMDLLSSVDSNYIAIAFFSVYSIGMELLFSVDSIGIPLLFSVASNCIINAFFSR